MTSKHTYNLNQNPVADYKTIDEDILGQSTLSSDDVSPKNNTRNSINSRKSNSNHNSLKNNLHNGNHYNLNGHNRLSHNTHSTQYMSNSNLSSDPGQNHYFNTNHTQNTHQTQNSNLSNHSQITDRRSNEINKEIQRFEGVHPKIFEVYDLLNKLGNSLSSTSNSAHNSNKNSLSRSETSNSLSKNQNYHQNQNHHHGTGTNSSTRSGLEDQLRDLDQIRDNLIFIEDFFVKSPEWCLPKDVLDNQIRIGIIGSLNSGKSPLVHHFLTGQYQPEESPEGGRFKKHVQLDNDNYLLLLREEGDPISSTPFNNLLSNNEHTINIEQQVSNWLDAIIFVFNITDALSFQAVTTYYERLLMNSQNTEKFHEIPIMLVGTQDYIDETINPRVIENHHARALLERFGQPINNYVETCATYGLNVDKVFIDLAKKVIEQREFDQQILQNFKYNEFLKLQHLRQINDQQNLQNQINFQQQQIAQQQAYLAQVRNVQLEQHLSQMNLANSLNGATHPASLQPTQEQAPVPTQNAQATTGNYPRNTPATTYADIELSDNKIFSHLNIKSNLPELNPPELPQKMNTSNSDTPQDIDKKLSRKKSSKKSSILPWKQKTTNTSLDNFPLNSKSPHSSIRTTPNTSRKSFKKSKDKENIPVGLGTVIKCDYVKKISGGESKKFLTLLSDGFLRYYSSRSDFFDASSSYKQVSILSITIKINGLPAEMVLKQNSPTPSSNKTSSNFEIISSEGPHWIFHCETIQDRNSWCNEIQNLQKSKLEGDNIRNVNSLGEKINDSITKTQQQEFIKNLNKIPGNDKCADCSQTNPTWASLNLGILICIKCSGIHRNLGTHISKIRSLELDDWPKSSQKILLQIGNKISNNIWLHGYHGDKIENMNNSELELHITEKYVNKSFLKPLSTGLIKDLPNSLHRSLEMPQNAQTLEQFLTIYHHFPKTQLLSPICHQSSKLALHIAVDKGMILQTQFFIWAQSESCLIRDETGLNSVDLCKNKIEETGMMGLNSSHNKNLNQENYLIILQMLEKAVINL